MAELLRDFPPRVLRTEQGPLSQGLGVRLVLRRPGVQGELDLGEEGRFFPTDTALARWRAGSHGQAAVVYEERVTS